MKERLGHGIWQFGVVLIPRTWLDAAGDVESPYADHGMSAAWSSYRNPRLESLLGSLLPKSTSLNPSLTRWGAEQQDDIQLWRKGGKVNSVIVRFDLRSANMALFSAIARVTHELELAIVVPGTQRVVGPDVQSLLRAAAESEAAHYVLDPQSYLSEIDAANQRAT